MAPPKLTDEEMRRVVDRLYAYGIGDEEFNRSRIEYRAIEAAVHAKWEAMLKQEPCGFMWQHEETGRVGFAEESQREVWKKGNPRLSIVGSIYLAPQPAQQELLREASRILHEALRAIGKIKVERVRGAGYFHAEVDWLVQEEQNIVALRRAIEGGTT